MLTRTVSTSNEGTVFKRNKKQNDYLKNEVRGTQKFTTFPVWAECKVTRGAEPLQLGEMMRFTPVPSRHSGFKIKILTVPIVFAPSVNNV